MHLWALFILLIVSFNVVAYEVDNFTQRYEPLQDSRSVLNEETNLRIKKALELTNAREKECKEATLENYVENNLGGSIVGSMEKFAEKSTAIEKHKSQPDNIYSSRSLMDKVASSGMLTLAGLDASININGHYIGTDKLGHFFDEGYSYLIRFRTKENFEEGVKAAMEYGRNLESGIFGLDTTGIFSNGDLAANYDGFIFWTQLTKGSNPYFKCVDTKWVQIRSFDWADYVKPSWDEAINCSTYRNDSITASVEKQSKTLEEKYKALGSPFKFSCPVSANECVKLKSYYGDKAASILGPKCLNAVRNPEESSTISKQIPSNISGAQLPQTALSAPPQHQPSTEQQIRPVVTPRQLIKPQVQEVPLGAQN